jgi:hypothetical protein
VRKSIALSTTENSRKGEVQRGHEIVRRGGQDSFLEWKRLEQLVLRKKSQWRESSRHGVERKLMDQRLKILGEEDSEPGRSCKGEHLSPSGLSRPATLRIGKGRLEG